MSLAPSTHGEIQSKSCVVPLLGEKLGAILVAYRDGKGADIGEKETPCSGPDIGGAHCEGLSEPSVEILSLYYLMSVLLSSVVGITHIYRPKSPSFTVGHGPSRPDMRMLSCLMSRAD